MAIWIKCIILIIVVSGSQGSDICETCFCNGYNIDCSFRKLSSIPTDIPKSTKRLLLNGNNISTIPDHIFNSSRKLIYLDISDNPLKTINIYSFYGLNHLKVLNIGRNIIPISYTGYTKGIFEPLKQLTDLDVSTSRRIFQFNISYPDETFSDLQSLVKLKLTGLSTFTFGSGFSKLKKLKLIDFSTGCVTTDISNTSFINVPHIQHLKLAKCMLLHIDKKAFSPLTHLQTLDLSYNRHLGLTRATLPLEGITSKQMNHLDIRAVVPHTSLGVEITPTEMKRIQRLNLRSINVDHNRIELVAVGALWYLPQTVKVLTFTDNEPIFGFYLLGLKKLKSLVYLDSSQQFKSHSPRRRSVKTQSTMKTLMSKHVQSYFKNTLSVTGINSTIIPKESSLKAIIPITLPPNLKVVNCSLNNMHYPIPKLVFAPNKVETLDVSHNAFNKWRGPLIGVNNLKYLNLSQNFCDHIEPDFFSETKNLEELYISSNFLSTVFEGDVYGEIFQNLTLLKVLDISDNKIRTLPRQILKGLKNLERLDVSKNLMRHWDLNIEHMLNLTYINLSNNIFTSLSSNLTKFCDKQEKRNKTVLLDMSGQILQCTCEHLDFLTWMNKNQKNFINFNNYTCFDKQQEEIYMTNLQDIVFDLRKQCASYTGVIVLSVCCILFIFTLIIGIYIYRYRWKLRYLYYLTRLKYRSYLANAQENIFQYDAFVSYADEDRRLVVNDMVKKLENEKEIQLNIHHRDFLVGEDIAANILNAVRHSRKTLIILSRYFINSYWCNYELNMAHMESLQTNRNVLIVIVYEYIPVNDLPPLLAQLLKNDSYIEYTDDPNGNIVFWDNLTRAIKTD